MACCCARKNLKFTHLPSSSSPILFHQHHHHLFVFTCSCCIIKLRIGPFSSSSLRFPSFEISIRTLPNCPNASRPLPRPLFTGMTSSDSLCRASSRSFIPARHLNDRQAIYTNLTPSLSAPPARLGSVHASTPTLIYSVLLVRFVPSVGRRLLGSLTPAHAIRFVCSSLTLLISSLNIYVNVCFYFDFPFFFGFLIYICRYVFVSVAFCSLFSPREVSICWNRMSSC